MERGVCHEDHAAERGAGTKLYRSQMVRDFPESELKPFASVQGMMTRGLYEPLAFYDEAGA